MADITLACNMHITAKINLAFLIWTLDNKFRTPKLDNYLSTEARSFASRQLGIMTDRQIYATSAIYSANLNAYTARLHNRVFDFGVERHRCW